jgi:hypothetical protein
MLALGVALVLNTRPFEGFVLTAVAGIALGVMLARRGVGTAVILRRIAAPTLLVLIPTGTAMAYYNWRVFGNPLTLPYTLNRKTYASAPVFVFQKPAPEPPYRHTEFRQFYIGWEFEHFKKVTTPVGFLAFSGHKLITWWQFYLGPVLTLPLVALPFALRSRRLRPLVWMVAVVAATVAFEAFFMPHYVAPLTAAFLALLIEALRRLRVWRRRERTGVALVRAVFVVCAVMIPVRMAAAFVPWVNTKYPMTWATTWNVSLGRQEIAARLLHQKGRHLVIVRYGPMHSIYREYVYNAANIDDSPLVWARDMGRIENEKLIRYFKGRRVWLLEPDSSPLKLMPYESSDEAADDIP